MILNIKFGKTEGTFIKSGWYWETWIPLSVTPCVHWNCSQPWIFAHTAFASLMHPPVSDSSVLVLWMCVSGLLMLPPAPPTLRTHKNTHGTFVCLVCLDRQGVPWVFWDNVVWLNYTYLFSFHVWKNKLASLQLLPLSRSSFPAVETNLLLFLFSFKSPTHS